MTHENTYRDDNYQINKVLVFKLDLLYLAITILVYKNIPVLYSSIVPVLLN